MRFILLLAFWIVQSQAIANESSDVYFSRGIQFDKQRKFSEAILNYKVTDK